MEADLNFFKNGRLPQFFSKMEDDLNFWEREDNLNFWENENQSEYSTKLQA